jgi:acyl-CoA synthetase (AMP-forming)/AMP-acid ligase II
MDWPTIAEMLAARAREAPDALAFSFENDAITRGALLADAEEIARAFVSEGIVAGDRVALLMPAGLDLVRTFYALQRLGATPCIFDPAVSRRAELIAPRLVVREVPSVGHGSLPAVSSDPDAIAFLQPTSGTTGEPRAAMVLQRHVMASLDAARQRIEPFASDVMVCWVPPWHDLGLLRFLLGPIAMGLPCHLVEPSVRTIPRWFARSPNEEERSPVLRISHGGWRHGSSIHAPSICLRCVTRRTAVSRCARAPSTDSKRASDWDASCCPATGWPRTVWV